MPTHVPSEKLTRALSSIGSFLGFVTGSTWARRQGEPGLCDFVMGNPQEMPLPGLVTAFQQALAPRNKDWFAYKVNEAEPRAVLAESLRRWRGVSYAPEDIFLATGAFGAFASILLTILQEDDEVVINPPPWFFYEPLVVAYGGRVKRVPVDSRTFDLDVPAIAAALGPRTRAVIVNSPNNPTGKVYPPETLAALGAALTEASRRFGRTIYLLSDEAYSRILFDGRTYHSATTHYPNSFLIYTYGKALLAPSQRTGYFALPPEMPDRDQLRLALFSAQLLTGWSIPNALLQHALKDYDALTIDVAQLQRRRDRMTSELGRMGYEVTVPEGTFYVLVRSPWKDDVAFVEELTRHNVYCLPGSVLELPGFFRISLTANDDMVERGLPGFAAALKAQAGATSLP